MKKGGAVMQQKAENMREILEFLLKAKKQELLTYKESIKKCTREIKDFEKMLEILDNKKN